MVPRSEEMLPAVSTMMSVTLPSTVQRSRSLMRREADCMMPASC